MPSVWWDVILWELLPSNQTITAQYYCEQLQWLSIAMSERRPNRQRIILHHDNARPHTANVTKETVANFGWEILPQPPYSPDLAPTDYHLFLSLANHLRGHQFETDTQLETFLSRYISEKTREFFSRGFLKFPERWEYVVNSGGD